LLAVAVQQGGVQVGASGWRLVLGACVVPAILTFFLRTFVPESEKWRQAARSGPRVGLADIFSPELRWRSLLGAVMGGVALIATWGSVQWVPLWVGQLTNQQTATLAQICSGLGAVVGSFLAPVVGARLGRRPTYFVLCLGP